LPEDSGVAMSAAAKTVQNDAIGALASRAVSTRHKTA
jgi:hypothetical protein